MKVHLILLVLLAAMATDVSAQSKTPKGPKAIEVTPQLITTLSDEARTNHPALLAGEASIEAARANENSIRTWEDPMVRFGVMGAEKMMRMEDGDLIYGVEQMLPLFGKPASERNVAKAATEVQTAELDFEFQELRRDIAIAVFRTALAERVVEIGEQDLSWLNSMLEATEQRYETGESAQFDVLRLQNERSKRINQVKTDEKLLAQEHVNLNRLISRPLHASWPALRLPSVAEPVLYNQRLVEFAQKYEPKLKVLDAEIEEGKAMVEMARRKRYPDINLGAEVRQYSESGELRQGMVMLSLNVPWGNRKKYDADITREREKLKATRLEQYDESLAVQNEVYGLIIKIDSARREALLYRDDIVPRSETALESATFALESGQGTFTELLEARRMLLEAQLMYARAVSEQYQMMSDLVLCCGLGDFEALQMIGAIPDTQTSEKK